LASCTFVAELIRVTNDHSAMFAFAIWSRFSPPEFPNVSSAVSFCSYHASVLHKSSSQCLKCEKLPAGLAGTIQAQMVDGMAKSATNREKLLLSCGDLQKQLAKLRLVVGAYFAWPDAPARSRSLSSPLPCAASPELGPGCPIHSRSLRMCVRAHPPPIFSVA
jgi:hypothetical protein